jgi:hypothetical protein
LPKVMVLSNVKLEVFTARTAWAFASVILFAGGSGPSVGGGRLHWIHFCPGLTTENRSSKQDKKSFRGAVRCRTYPQ